MKKTLLITLVVALSTFSCVETQIGPCTSGNRNLSNEIRYTEEFHGISTGLQADVNVIITENPTDEIVIHGESNIINHVNTEVVDGILQIDMDGCFRVNSSFSITVESSYLDYLVNAGSGDINVTGVNTIEFSEVILAGSGDIRMDVEASELVLSDNGSGNLYIAGFTDELYVKNTGSGTLFGIDLKSYNTFIEVLGSGDVNTWIEGQLEVKIAGSGSVFYRGYTSDIIYNKIGSGSLIEVY